MAEIRVDQDILWNDVKPGDDYPKHEKWHGHLLEQYKMYVEMADRISQRRTTDKRFTGLSAISRLSSRETYTNNGNAIRIEATAHSEPMRIIRSRLSQSPVARLLTHAPAQKRANSLSSAPSPAILVVP